MYMLALVVTLLIAAGSTLAIRHGRCRHRFGRPTSGYVCCLRCTRRFPIQYTTGGEWRIGKTPLDRDPPAHPPLS